MKTKHTPGPWHAVEYAGTWNIQDEPFYTGNNLLDEDLFEDGQAEANAKLMAAAPDMFEACIKLQEWNKKYPPGRIYEHGMGLIIEKELTEIVEIQIEAIKKATE